MAPSTRIIWLPAALALAAALLVAMISAGPASAQGAAASGCSGVTLTASSKKVKPGGKVLLSGRSCGATAASSAPAPVKLKIRNGRRWKAFAEVSPDSAGEFSTCIRINASRRVKKVSLQAVAPGGKATATLAVSPKGSKRCPSQEDDSEQAAAYKPPPPEQGNPACPLSQPGSAIGMTLPSSCTVVASDTASNPDPIPFYGAIDCETASRHQQLTSGGDPHQTAIGSGQGNSMYRRTTVIDGDDFWGERCELGHNNWPTSPVVYYHEGMRRVTYVSVRLPSNLPLGTDNWQGALQMKQTQPSDNGGGTPVLSLSAFEGKWQLWHSQPGYTVEDQHLWSVPAQNGVWTRFAFDVTYSQNPSQGRVKLYVDLNADGDFSDGNEQSPSYQTNTLKYETGTDNSDGIAAGQSIPAHLRLGIYHHPEIPCPNPVGCSVELDNVQVVKA